MSILFVLVFSPIVTFLGWFGGGRETYLGFVGGGKCLWLLVVGVVELFADS